MNIRIVTPTAPQAVTGNVFTAERYARFFRGLGHRVAVAFSYDGSPCDVLIALHARRSADAVYRISTEYPDRPVIVVLTGTDLYRDIRTDADAQRSLALATRLVVLQRMGLLELPPPVRDKTRVIYQSAPCLRARVDPPRTYFRVCVIGHLRPEKDPLRAALAVRQLPRSSRIRVIHVGAALSPELGELAAQESATNPRYRWVGRLPHWKARHLLAGSHVLAITSVMEGSSNVLGESLAQPSPTPVVASRISGLVGTLGEDYPGYFPVGDTTALAELLQRAESDLAFQEELSARCRRVAPLVMPERELESWRRLLEEVA